MKLFLIKTLSLLAMIFGSMAAYGGSDKADITKLLKTYEQALNDSNTSKILKLYSTDPIFMPQGSRALEGRASVEKGYVHVFENLDLNVKFDIYEIEIYGNTAWARTSSSGKTKLLKAGTTVKEGNNELFVFKKQKGQWKIHRYLFATTVAH